MLRYSFDGEVHKDFHGLMCSTLHYLHDTYGEEALSEILQQTAQKVFKTMHDGLKRGSACELLEYWDYYFKREQGEFSIEFQGEEIRLIVKKCPAMQHLAKLGLTPDQLMCDATAIFNSALTAGTPFSLTTERTGDISCIQILKKKDINHVAE